MKKFIMYGAGNIGRGFIGQTFSEAGYKVGFVDINKEVISRSLPCCKVSVGDILDCAFNTIGPRFRRGGVFGEFALFITWVEVVIAVIGHSELNRLNHGCDVHGVVRHSFK